MAASVARFWEAAGAPISGPYPKGWYGLNRRSPMFPYVVLGRAMHRWRRRQIPKGAGHKPKLVPGLFVVVMGRDRLSFGPYLDAKLP